MTFGDYVRILRTYWKSLLLVTVLAVAAAGGISFAMTPKYTATAGVLFTPVATDEGGESLAFAAQYTQSRMVVYQGLADTPQVLGAVVSKLDLDATPTQLADQVSASFSPASTLLTISVEDESAALATEIASGVAQSLIAAVVTFETQPNPSTTEGQQQTVPRVSGRLVSDPVRPTSPSSPDWKLNLVAGLLLGLILATAQAGVRFLRARSAGTLPAPPAPAAAEPPAPAEPAPPAPPAAVEAPETTPETAPETTPVVTAATNGSVARVPAGPALLPPPIDEAPVAATKPGKRTRKRSRR